jgi:hypothetical protein
MVLHANIFLEYQNFGPIRSTHRILLLHSFLESPSQRLFISTIVHKAQWLPGWLPGPLFSVNTGPLNQVTPLRLIIRADLYPALANDSLDQVNFFLAFVGFLGRSNLFGDNFLLSTVSQYSSKWTDLPTCAERLLGLFSSLPEFSNEACLCSEIRLEDLLDWDIEAFSAFIRASQIPALDIGPLLAGTGAEGMSYWNVSLSHSERKCICTEFPLLSVLDRDSPLCDWIVASSTAWTFLVSSFPLGENSLGAMGGVFERNELIT